MPNDSPLTQTAPEEKITLFPPGRKDSKDVNFWPRIQWLDLMLQVKGNRSFEIRGSKCQNAPIWMRHISNYSNYFINTRIWKKKKRLVCYTSDENYSFENNLQTVKGALDKYNIYLFMSNSIEDLI